MQTIAWLFIITAIVLIRQVSKGRADELPGDLRDFMLAMLSGDNAGMKEVAGRTGDTLTPTQATAPQEGSSSVSGTAGGIDGASTNGLALLNEARKIGKGKPYLWGATGPNSYDCSGLVWRAARNIGVYKGVRFTTHTFRAQSKGWAQEVSSPAVGDVVLWTDHMGIVSGPGRMFNALGTKYGVLESDIASARRGKPSYWRITV